MKKYNWLVVTYEKDDVENKYVICNSWVNDMTQEEIDEYLWQENKDGVLIIFVFNRGEHIEKV